MTNGLVWFRRDLRLDDNPVWARATRECDELTAVFVLDDRLLDRTGPHRMGVLMGSLVALDNALANLGGRLRIVSGRPERVVPGLAVDITVDAVFHHDDVTEFARRRDAAVGTSLSCPVVTEWSTLHHEPGTVLTQKGTISRVFTPFHKAWERTTVEPWDTSTGGASVSAVTDLEVTGDPALGIDGVDERLSAALARADDYADRRDLPAVDGTSQLGADLKFGTLSARTMVDEVGTDSGGRAALTRQIAWRDWYAHTLLEQPTFQRRALRAEYERIEWRDDPDGLRRWAEGQTGYPIVDAGMRQLAATGWMHNRVRMIVGSFLVKDLLIDWRLGEAHFRRLLIDADIPQNVGNWQWVAGTGPDAAPYFRIFNPVSQSKKFDPDGDYIRRWVPELAGLDRRSIHAPWEVGPLDLAVGGVVIGDDYPAPMVDHHEARQRTLEAYSVVKN